MKTKIKRLRKELDGLAQLTKELIENKIWHVDFTDIPEEQTVDQYVEKNKNNVKNKYTIVKSKEIERSVDNLYLAKAWLGEILNGLGVETPYKNDGNRKTVEDVEETADTSDLDKEKQLMYSSNNIVLRDAILTQQEWDEKSHIEKVDWLREEIKKIISEVEQIAKTSSQSFTKEFNISRTNSYTHLSEARFHLGFELSRCRDEQ